MSEWISVDERLPEEKEPVLLSTVKKVGEWPVGVYRGRLWKSVEGDWWLIEGQGFKMEYVSHIGNHCQRPRPPAILAFAEIADDGASERGVFMGTAISRFWGSAARETLGCKRPWPLPLATILGVWRFFRERNSND